MDEKRKLLVVRVRRNSDLEKIQKEDPKSLPDLIHSWAFQFRNNVAQSDEGESDDHS